MQGKSPFVPSGVSVKTLSASGIVRVMFVLFVIGHQGNHATMAQDANSGIRVGDLIEFEFIGQRDPEVVREIDQAGWMTVDVEHAGSKGGTFATPGQGTLVRHGRQDKVDGASRFPDDYRTWTDATQKFTVEATIFELSDTEVKLLKRDAKVVTLPIAKLCRADQDYLQQVREKQLAEQNPFEGGTAIEPKSEIGSPLGPKDVAAAPVTPKALERGQLPISGSGKLVKIENEVRLDPVAWTYVPPSESATFLGQKSISLNEPLFAKDKAMFAKSKFYFSSDTNPFVAVLRTNDFQEFSEVLVLDKIREQVVGHFKLPMKDVIDVVVSPGTRTVVTLQEPFATENGGLVFWRMEDGELVPEKAWPFAGWNRAGRFIAKSCAFVDDRHLFTVGTHLALWNIETGKCVYSVTKPGAWATNHDNSYVVFFHSNSLWILRIKDGTVVGELKGQPKLMASLQNLSFAPDGLSLAASAGRSIYVYDLTSGTLKYSYDSGSVIGSLGWADHSLLLVNGSQIVDPRLEVAVWSLAVPQGYERTQLGATTWILHSGSLFSFELINDNRRTEIERSTAGLTADDLRIVGRGTRIAVQADLQHLNADAEPTLAALKKRLQDLGYVIDESAPLRLEAIVGRGEEVNELVREHMRSAFGAVQERVRYTPHWASLKLSLNGEILWQTSANYTADGPFLRMQINETPQGAVDRLCKPDPKFFSNAAIPDKVSRLLKERKGGRSQVTATGLQ